jgi:hypothetical protein
MGNANGKIVVFIPSRGKTFNGSDQIGNWADFTLHKETIRGYRGSVPTHIKERIGDGTVDVHLGELSGYVDHKDEIDRCWDEEIGGKKEGMGHVQSK